ncbi:MAG: RidA family protein [Actinocrinis sp.]
MSATVEPVSTGVAHRIGRYSDAVRVRAGQDLVFVSGTPGLRADGSVPEDFGEEARQAWRNVQAALEAAGVGLGDVVNVRQWLTDAGDVPAYAAVRAQFIKHEPTFMLGVVSGLVWPRLRVEIEVTAARSGADG